MALAVAALALAGGTTSGVAGASTPYTILGFYPGDENGNLDIGRAGFIYEWQGKGHGVINLYGGDPSVIPLYFNWIWDNHRAVPMFSYYPPTPNSAVAAGTFDSQFTALISSIKSWIAGPDGVFGNGDDRRMYLRYAWESNASGYKYSPCTTDPLAIPEPASTFVAAWRRVHDMFVVAGLDNTRGGCPVARRT